MLFKQVLMLFFFLFFVLGIADRFLGNRFGIGAEFNRAFGLMGQIALSIVGMICLAPVLADILEPVIVPLYTAIGADPGMFAPNFISADSGGYMLALELAENREIGRWAGACVASLLGGTLSFSIPVMFGLIPKANYRAFSVGALSGLIAAPFGCIAGGLVFGLTLTEMIRNLIPVIAVAMIIVLGLLFLPSVSIRAFILFSRGMTLLILFGFSAAVLERITGIVLIENMLPLADGMIIAGTVTAICAGTMCFLFVAMRVFRHQINWLADKSGVSGETVLHILIALATIIPGGSSYDKMTQREQVIFGAIVCSIANILGAHMSYLGTTDPELLLPMFSGKLIAAVAAIPLALFFAGRLLRNEKNVYTSNTDKNLF